MIKRNLARRLERLPHRAFRAVNQWVVRNEANGEREPPNPVGAPKKRQPGRCCLVSPFQETPFYGRFLVFLGPVNRLTAFRSAYLPPQAPL
jgi:hypothetical protein